MMNEYNEKVIKEALTLLREKENEEIRKEMEEANKIPEFRVKEGEAERFVKQFEKKRSRKAWLRAASIVVVMVVSLTVVTLSVDGFREKFTSFFTNFTSEEYAGVKVGEEDDLFMSYKGQFVPSVIPEGYEVESVVNSTEYFEISLTNKEDCMIVMREQSSAVKSNIDTEDADVINDVEINGMKGLYFKKGNSENILLNSNETMLHIVDNDEKVDLIGFVELIEKR